MRLQIENNVRKYYCEIDRRCLRIHDILYFVHVFRTFISRNTTIAYGFFFHKCIFQFFQFLQKFFNKTHLYITLSLLIENKI